MARRPEAVSNQLIFEGLAIPRPSSLEPSWFETRFALLTMRVLGGAAALLIGFLISPAYAVEPGEMLKDPVLEARARTISEGLRCLVCQNESIDDSHAELAQDIRLLVRQRLQAGDTNQQVRDYLVARYGQFILLKPPFEAQTLLLWGTPLLVLVLGSFGVLMVYRRSRTARDPAQPLNAAEQRRLDELLSERSPTGS